MANIRQLIENKQKLDYAELCKALILQFGVTETVNWESVLPASQQQELFGGEVLRQIADHPQLSNQKDIRPISLKKGSVSQMLFFYVTLADSALQKKHIENITKRFIKGTDANRYIIWFFGNKENTALKVVLSGKEGKKVVLKTLPFVTNEPYYKTYELILNLVNEKVNALFVEPADLWKALWKAFDVSIINKHFYDDIKKGFDELLTQLNKKGNPFKTEEERVQFSIRLIGRVIFCWFLKRKGILSKEVLSSDAVENTKDKNYYHDLLELLFFEVMNKPEKERAAGLPKLIVNYPFLNGGLFDAQKNDFYTGKTNYQLNIDNKWFIHFFANTLEKYNFTVDENSSSSAEIAIDPEMLGRIFENLLAEQNPETGESARKSTGSFYTPREIVDYMVEQSIAEHIKTYITKFTEHQIEVKEDLFGNVPLQQLTIPKEPVLKLHNTWQQEVEEFAHTAHLPNNLKEITNYIVDALNNLKVLDPACGSGAFPIGVLQKIVALKSELFQLLNPKKQLNNAAIYQLKLDTIQNSIYGIDIQPMAVELSRLRCWLSLVVDEEITNIKALPNLDFKFVCADTLIDVPEDEYVKNKCADSLNQFAIATANYFNPDHKKKKELKDTITNCLRDITKTHDIVIKSIIEQTRKEQKTASPTRLKQLEKMLLNHSNQQAIWHTYNNIFENKKVDFFNINYFFPVAKDGFDIVIGNPPYVSISKLSNKKALQENNYKTFESTGDLYSLFYEKGNQLLKEKGNLAYITSNKWMRAGYGKSLRNYFTESTNPIKIIDFGQTLMFESAIVHSNILIFSKEAYKKKTFGVTFQEDYLKQNISFQDYFEAHKLLLDKLNSDIWTVATNSTLNFKLKAEKIGTPLKNWNIDFYRGLLTGYNEAFIIDGATKDNLIKQDSKNIEIIKPILRGRDVRKYHCNFGNYWIINSHNGIKSKNISRIDVVKNYPSIYKYLKQFQDKAETRADQGEHWTNLRNCAYLEEIEKPKIVFSEIVSSAQFHYDTEKFYPEATVFFISGENLKYLIALLNSKPVTYLFKTFYSGGELVGKFRYKKAFLENLPIPKISETAQKLFVDIVNLILTIKESKIENSISKIVSNNLITKYLEDIIDGMVLELYFEEEMKGKKIDIIELVEKELKQTQANTTEESIYNFYKSVSHPDSVIRNRILSFAIASPTILKPILQG